MRRFGGLISLLSAAAAANGQQLPVEVIAITGQQAPGMAPGVIFSELGTQNFPGTTAIQGTVSFLAKVSGPGISTTNNTTLWLGTAGAPQLIRQTGPVPPRLDRHQFLRAFRRRWAWRRSLLQKQHARLHRPVLLGFKRGAARLSLRRRAGPSSRPRSLHRRCAAH